MFERIKQLEREIETFKARSTASSAASLINNVRVSSKGVRAVVEKVSVDDIDSLKAMVDQVRLQIGSGIIALASPQGDSAILVAGSTSDLHKSVHVGTIVKEAAQLSGGKGGGRADFAQAGGIDPTKIDLALKEFFNRI